MKSGASTKPNFYKEDKPALTIPPMAPLQASKTPLHTQLGITPEYTRHQYMKIVHQDENLPAKLKALTPLAREIGLDPDPQATNPTQTIIFMMPQEISQKNKLIHKEARVIDAE